MNTLNFLTRLKKRGIELWIENNEMCFRAKKGMMTDAIKRELRERKQEVIHFLAATSRLNEERPDKLQPAPTDAPAELSYAQEGLWFMEEREAGTILHHIPIAFHISGPLDAIVACQVLTRLIRRHQSLRTYFKQQEGRPLPQVEQSLRWSTPIININNLPRSERRTVSRSLVATLARKPFQLGRAPLFRAAIVQLSSNEHVLAMNVHHLVFDGWSMGIFMSEWCTLYTYFLRGLPSPLPPLPITYSDYVFHQRRMLDESKLEKQLEWWHKNLTGVPICALRADRTRPKRRTYNGANLHFVLPARVRHQLLGLANENQLSFPMVVTAAFLVLIYRYTGQLDLCVGTAMGNRKHKEIEGVIGLFVNLLAMRVGASGNPTFRQFLRRVRETWLATLMHGDVPFERVVAKCWAATREDMFPFFNMQVVLTEGLTQDTQPLGISMTPFFWGSGVVARRDITLLVSERGDYLAGDLEYNTDLFDELTIKRLAHHLVNLLEAASAKPNTAIDQLDLMGTREREQLARFNETDTHYPRDQTIHGLFEQTCEQLPQRAALTFEEDSLTYTELNAHANRLAGFLAERGVLPAAMVGLCLEQGPDRVAVMLAILKLGAVFVPLDPHYPKKRLTFMIQETGMKTLISQKSLQGEMPPNAPDPVLLDQERTALARQSVANQSRTIPAQSGAYVMFTSGTSGRPKGVFVPHRGVVRLVKKNSYLSISSRDVFLQSASISFDASSLELWAPLTNGARLVLAKTTEEVPNLLRRHEITILWLTAQLFHLMVDRHLSSLAGVNQLLAGGEVLSPDHVRRFMDAYPKIKLINGYGPTENTTFTCTCSLQLADQASYPIGRPIANTTLFVADRFLNQLPIGIVGELFTSGDGLALGYLQRPALTAEAFVPNPFSSQPGTRLYRSGDLVRHQKAESGELQLEFIGRVDRQLKLRGYCIEPSEVEAHLKQHPQVAEAHVFPTKGENDEVVLQAFVTRNSPPAEDDTLHQTLLRHLSENLPAFMMPNALRILQTLPRTANGKLDQDALLTTDWSDPKIPSEVPTSPTEELLAGIWVKLLAKNRVSRSDHFFELGGHSLLANRLAGDILDIFAVHVTVRTLFEKPVLADLAMEIDRLTAGGSTANHLPPIVANAGMKGHSYPLSYAQERLWFLDQLKPASAMYSVPIALRLTGALHQVVLHSCFNEITRRHQSLCSHFTVTDGKPRQTVKPHGSVPFTIVDLRHYPVEKREFEGLRHIAEAALWPFDLEQGNLLRLLLYQLDDSQHLLLVNMHHIVSDGWSLRILFNELASLYAAFSQNKPSPLPPLPIQYIDYASWQRQWLKGSRRENQFTYWCNQLAGAPTTLELPMDFRRPKVQTFRGSGEHFLISEEVTAQFDELCRAHGVTAFMALISIYAYLLSRYCGQQDVCIGTPIANRDHRQTQNLIGFFLNTLVMRFDLRAQGAQELSYAALLKQARKTALDAYAHQDLPFEQLVSKLQPERDLSRSPLFQVAFSWDSELTDTEVRLPGLLLQHQAIDYHIAKFDLSLGMDYSQGRLQGSFGYNTDLFKATSIARMSRHFQKLLLIFIQNPNRAMDASDPMDQAERRRLLVAINQTENLNPFPPVHLAFQQAAAEFGPQIACSHQATKVTYQTLEETANRLAHFLRRLGVATGMLVAVCSEPTPELVLAQLAILKAGAAFVPLDPNYPTDRLADMLADSGVPVVISTAQYAKNLPRQHGRLVLLDQDRPDWDELQKESILPRTSIRHEQLPAYMIYTSGSMGQAKGVVINHLSLSNLVSWHQQAFEVNPDDRASKLAPVGFDASVWELWPYLTKGAALFMADSHLLKDACALQDWLVRHRISHCFIPTVVTELLLELKWHCDISLRYMLTGGDLLHRFPSEPLPFKLINNYGPTENSVVTTSTPVTHQEAGVYSPLIGRPIRNTSVYILDTHMRPTLPGVSGELHISGIGLAREYLGRPALTASHFVPNPFALQKRGWGNRLYKSGDLARFYLDERDQIYNIEFLGRQDNQVKLRGYRIELGEIEHHLCTFKQVSDAIVLLVKRANGDSQLVGYVQVKRQQSGERITLDTTELSEYLSNKLPTYMVPPLFVVLDHFPLTSNGKVDRHTLATSTSSLTLSPPASYEPPKSGLERKLSKIWAELLGLERVGTETNFFELGGHSLLLARVQSKMAKDLNLKPDMLTLFRYTTIRTLAKHLLKQGKETYPESTHCAELRKSRSFSYEAIAIVGITARLPGAKDVAAFWQNLCSGVESIQRLDDAEMLAAGVAPQMLTHKDYVKRGAAVQGIEFFDANFFEITPQEAKTIDPQQRIFLEHAWLALEHAGYNPETPELTIGLYASAGLNAYLHHNLLAHPQYRPSMNQLQGLLGNDLGFLATRVSYKLNLRGPSVNVQTACSSSLVAVHLACQALLNGECDLALAGGVSLQLPQRTGYLYQQGLPLSQDGSCRAFDRKATGTVRSGGVAIVVLKPLKQAITDGDTLYATIKGTAINNDGAARVGYTAPSVEGQAAVIREALAIAQVSPESVGYIETHGTGTPIGDPIEISALHEAYQQGGAEGTRAIGSLKTNIGHLDAAAGIAGLIKTALCLHHRTLVPSLHFQEASKDLKLGQLFRVNTQTRPWHQKRSTPRRAGVSSFGIGGTNVHAILEEAPKVTATDPAPERVLFVLSAKTQTALDNKTDQLRGYLAKQHHSGQAVNLGDVAHTLAVGRYPFKHRRFLVCGDQEDAQQALSDRNRHHQGICGPHEHRVVFLFPGQASQYVYMGQILYKHDTGFQEDLDECQTLLNAGGEQGLNLLGLLYPETKANEHRIHCTEYAQPVLFSFSWALARWWMRRGVRPVAMLGHSLGEYVAATLAEVFTLADALKLLNARGRVMAAQPEGFMLSVAATAGELEPFLSAEINLAAENHSRRQVLSGNLTALATLEQKLTRAKLRFSRLISTAGFHSYLMEPVMEPFEQVLSKIQMSPPRIPFISNLTGTWIEDAQASDPHYWARHLREPVLFAKGLERLADLEQPLFLEVGPGQALTRMVKGKANRIAIASLPINGTADAQDHLLKALGLLWLAGVPVDWAAHRAQSHRQRLALPGYPFERVRHWVEPPPEQGSTVDRHLMLRALDEMGLLVEGAADTLNPHTLTAKMRQLFDEEANPEIDNEPSESLVTNGQMATGTEQQLAEIWSKCLGIEVDDNQASFMELGGDSLALATVHSDIQRIFQNSLPLQELFDRPKLAELAAHLDQMKNPS